MTVKLLELCWDYAAADREKLLYLVVGSRQTRRKLQYLYGKAITTCSNENVVTKYLAKHKLQNVV